MKSKIQELEKQILILNQEQLSLNQSKEALSSELSMVKYALTTSNNEKDNLKKQLEKLTSDKTSVENKLKVKQDDNTVCLGTIVVVLFIGLIVSVVLKDKTEQLQDEKQKIENKLQSISNEVPFIVTSIDFENSAEKNNYKRNFNYYKVRYISPRLKIIPIANNWSGKVSVKYFSPSGILDRNPSISPEGFTFDYETSAYSTQEYIYLSGWGSARGSTYEVGTHEVEIWYNGKIIGKQTFTVSY